MEEFQILDVSDKYFKNMCKELKEIMPKKKSKESMTTRYHQIDNISEKVEIVEKEPSRNARVEKYNYCNKNNHWVGIITDLSIKNKGSANLKINQWRLSSEWNKMKNE